MHNIVAITVVFEDNQCFLLSLLYQIPPGIMKYLNVLLYLASFNKDLIIPYLGETM